MATSQDPPRTATHPAPPSRQATVSEFDAVESTGAVLLDSGARVEFPAAAFAAGGLRLLRLGQRVRLDYATDGRVRTVTLITMP